MPAAEDVDRQLPGGVNVGSGGGRPDGADVSALPLPAGSSALAGGPRQGPARDFALPLRRAESAVQLTYLLHQIGDRARHHEIGNDLRDRQGQDWGRADSQLGEPGAHLLR